MIINNFFNSNRHSWALTEQRSAITGNVPHRPYSAYRLSLIALFGLMSGCAFLPSTVEIIEVPTEPVATRPEPAPPPVQRAPSVPAQPTRTAVLLSNNIPAFVAIADELAERLGREHVTIYNLHGQQANAKQVLGDIAAQEVDQLVAIGLLAATVGRRLEHTAMVFCQVYNYQDRDLLSSSGKGVNFLPPFAIQLEAWRNLSPSLQRIGIITGPGQDSLIAEIQAATDQADIRLAVRTVHSDKEALYAFKRLTPQIQGLWLLPDNRILSPSVVREIMAYSARYRKQVVVFGSNLLGMGALMSVSSNDADVADIVLSRLQTRNKNGQLSGPDMLPLTQMHSEVNHEVARRLGLMVSEQLALVDSGD